ncbi:hypothetical protein ACOSQ2_016672 [Xanthoceras sorbifolium]|uniref:Transmembrane protein n=1 Tax=Xanthoceras sorbifolium TaxID=99658 RepID=A0ABQ8HIZ1_9ROSI|nr:hypothetical protein JRO89_XS10G0160800 [Xanthoceras sorbifolium]KAH7561035.1 hypothetical protein JRO89_XS10G0161300 [Xanthoceras sorbifolium]
MTPITSLLLYFFSLVAILSIATAQDRAPHGLAYETPMAFPPEAFNFFHPKTQDSDTENHPCAASNCSPRLPVAAQVQSTKAQESKYSTTPHKGSSRLGAGGIAGIVVALTFAVTLAMGAYFVVIKRRANANRAQANSVQPNV